MSDFKKITSKDNPFIKSVSGLQTSSRKRKESSLFVLEGLRICLDAAENGITFEALAVSEMAYEKYKEAVITFAKSSRECYILPDSLFKKISDTDSPQGIIALAKMPSFDNKPSKNGRYIGLENLSDPSNLGAIARTAEALGVTGIILSNGSVDPYSPKSLRASMGTLLRVPLFFADDLCSLAHSVGLRSIACVVDRQAEPITTVKFTEGDLLLIGNEASGLTVCTKERSQLRITIPMSGRAESLNAAAAAAIAMWEMMRGAL